MMPSVEGGEKNADAGPQNATKDLDEGALAIGKLRIELQQEIAEVRKERAALAKKYQELEKWMSKMETKNLRAILGVKMAAERSQAKTEELKDIFRILEIFLKVNISRLVEVIELLDKISKKRSKKPLESEQSREGDQTPDEPPTKKQKTV